MGFNRDPWITCPTRSCCITGPQHYPPRVSVPTETNKCKCRICINILFSVHLQKYQGQEEDIALANFRSLLYEGSRKFCLELGNFLSGLEDHPKTLSAVPRSARRVHLFTAMGEYRNKIDQCPYSPTILKNFFCPRFVNLNVTLLIGQTVWFSPSEVVLHPNASKYTRFQKKCALFNVEYFGN